MTEDHRRRIEQLLWESGLLFDGQFAAEIKRVIEDMVSYYEILGKARVEQQLILLERVFLHGYRNKHELAGKAFFGICDQVNDMRQRSRKGVNKMNKNRAAKSDDKWTPWKRRWLELQNEGLSPDVARTAVAIEMKDSGEWWGKGSEPSRSTLKRRLR